MHVHHWLAVVVYFSILGSSLERSARVSTVRVSFTVGTGWPGSAPTRTKAGTVDIEGQFWACWALPETPQNRKIHSWQRRRNSSSSRMDLAILSISRANIFEDIRGRFISYLYSYMIQRVYQSSRTSVRFYRRRDQKSPDESRKKADKVEGTPLTLE